MAHTNDIAAPLIRGARQAAIQQYAHATTVTVDVGVEDEFAVAQLSDERFAEIMNHLPEIKYVKVPIVDTVNQFGEHDLLGTDGAPADLLVTAAEVNFGIAVRLMIEAAQHHGYASYCLTLATKAVSE